jgi:hypothetical protein
MDRRIKFILLIIGTIILFGLVTWFILIPTLQPLFPSAPVQPPALPSGITPSKITPVSTSSSQTGGAGGSGVATFEPVASPDRELILSLSQRAGVVGARAESGSSANGFTNYDDASLNASAGLAAKFATMKKDMQKAHPSTGKLYLTTARLLVEKPENADVINGATFNVAVQMQVQVTDDAKVTTEYREATVTFEKMGNDWVANGYSVKQFTP